MVLIVTMPLGTSRDIKIYVTENGEVKTLGGATAVCVFVTAHGAEPTLVKKTSDDTITISGDLGLVNIHISPGDAGVLTVGTYLWECRVYDGSVQEVIESGTLYITESDSEGVLDE